MKNKVIKPAVHWLDKAAEIDKALADQLRRRQMVISRLRKAGFQISSNGD